MSDVAWDLFQDTATYRDILDANPGLDVFGQLPQNFRITVPSAEELVDRGLKVIGIENDLDLSAIKQPETGNPHQLISWILG